MGSYNDSAGTSSFTGYLSSHAPDLLPGFLQPGPEAVRGGSAAAGSAAAGSARPLELDHGTTIVAATYADGVVVAGDRRATMGSMIAKRDVRKVFRTDEYSVAGVAGTWSLAVSLMRLFQVELEHYEKLEGQSLSLVGKASRLAVMVKGNLGAAMQGLVVVPLFAGYDQDAGKGRIFSYDPFGGPYEESRFYSIGSGSIFARGSLKKLYTDDMPASDVILACVHALYDAADDDSATGGPDLARRLFPMIATVTADGFSWISDEESERYAREVVEQRLHSPDGPEAPLGGGAS
ncbi:MAG TPA: proteasome subunit beta [Streptosporangiaceae bacterium]